MTAYDVEPGDSGPPGRSGHRRPLHGRRAHQPLDHGDVPRPAGAVRPRAVPSEPVLPDRAVRRRADGRARSIPGSAWCCSSASSGCSCASGRPICGTREDGTWLARIRDVLTGHEERSAGGRQVQCRAEVRVLVDVDPDHRADRQRHRHLGRSISTPFTTIEQKRIAVLVHAHRGDRHHLRLDRPCLCGDLGARHDRRHDPRHGHRRLGLAASSQMAEGTGHRQGRRSQSPGAKPVR